MPVDDQIVVYDKAKWHYESSWPKGLPKKQACVHIGWMLGWLVDHDLISDKFKGDFLKDLCRFRKRRLTGPKLLQISGEALASDMVNQEANEFLSNYYGAEGKVPRISYFLDHERLFKSGLPTSYHARDSWENFERMSDQIQKRFNAWRKGPHKKRSTAKLKRETWRCEQCSRPTPFSVSVLTDGFCEDCFTLPDRRERRKMEQVLAGDRSEKDVLDAVRFHIPPDSSPKDALRRMKQLRRRYKSLFALFTNHGLMEGSPRPLWISGFWGELHRSDFKPLGYRLFKRCNKQWLDSLKTGANPTNLRIWSRELCRMRQGKRRLHVVSQLGIAAKEAED